MGGGGISLCNKYFSNWPQLMAPFYSILFETSICQFNSSKCYPIMPDEVRQHLTRDEVKASKVTFIYIALLTIQIVSKQLYNIKIEK